ncbi:MAG: 5-oxoprolinase subunit PxpA [Acidobacteriota bacterium]
MIRTIDLNCDMGEGCGNDAELMKFISSTNIACGFHAGDRATMTETVELALKHNVAIGAHPSYRDLENFGRTAMSLPSKEVFAIVVEQIEELRKICKLHGALLHHVKPHGALYNQAAKDHELAAAIAEAIASVDRDLILYGLSGSHLISEAGSVGLRTASEVFADRTYQSDGSLTPRSERDALITDPEKAVAQALQMIRSKTVTATKGEIIPTEADTLCIHGDGEHAVEFVKAIRESLAKANVRVTAPGLNAPAV